MLALNISDAEVRLKPEWGPVIFFLQLKLEAIQGSSFYKMLNRN
jgi:hypothetical protein